MSSGDKAVGAKTNPPKTKETKNLADYHANNRGNQAASSNQANNKAPSNPAEEMMISLDEIIQTSPSAKILIKAWADILQEELAKQDLQFELEKVSFTATIAVRSDKERKGRKAELQVKLKGNSSKDWSIEIV